MNSPDFYDPRPFAGRQSALYGLGNGLQESGAQKLDGFADLPETSI
jgi:hypothetical protein